MLEKPFGIVGKRVRIVKGNNKGKEGIVIEETGYTPAYGVICKVKLNDGSIGEYTMDFLKIFMEG